MTCIVALETENGVILGGDRMSSSTETGSPITQPKIFTKGEVTIGYMQSFRMGQLLQHALQIPQLTPDTDLDQWVTIDFAKALVDVYHEHGWLTMKEGSARGGNILLIVRNRVYNIQSDYSYVRYLSGEYAIGSGKDYALGSLRSTRGKMTPKERVLEALEASAEYVLSVGAPFDIIEPKTTESVVPHPAKTTKTHN